MLLWTNALLLINELFYSVRYQIKAPRSNFERGAQRIVN